MKNLQPPNQKQRPEVKFPLREIVAMALIWCLAALPALLFIAAACLIATAVLF